MPVAIAFVDVDLDVAAHPAMALAAKPRVIRSRRQGRFVLEVANEGNLALDVTLRATDADRAVTTVFTPSTLRVPAGSTAPVLLTVKGPRMVLGAEVDRVVAVKLTAVPASVTSSSTSRRVPPRSCTTRARDRTSPKRQR